jgi:hypothetical protein
MCKHALYLAITYVVDIPNKFDTLIVQLYCADSVKAAKITVAAH